MASAEFSDRIYLQAREGSPYNPGVPERLAVLMVKQAKHETADFSSRVFLEDNNAFGYKYYSGSPYQTDKGRTSTEGDPYAHYATIEDSTREIIDWLYRRKREGKFPDLATITTEEQYAQLLKASGYYGDPVAVYLEGLKRWVYKPVTLAAGGLLLLAVGSYLVYRYYIRKN
jgi:flagellum-specific peptidoglycan hydrolase FlgJ